MITSVAPAARIRITDASPATVWALKVVTNVSAGRIAVKAATSTISTTKIQKTPEPGRVRASRTAALTPPHPPWRSRSRSPSASSRARVPAFSPSRSTVTRSAIESTCGTSWEISSTPKSRLRRFWIRAFTASRWRTPSAAVGSSSSTTVWAQMAARAIATPCRWPPDSIRTGPLHVGHRHREPLECLPGARAHRGAVEHAEPSEDARRGGAPCRCTRSPRRSGGRRARGPGRPSRFRAGGRRAES